MKIEYSAEARVGKTGFVIRASAKGVPPGTPTPSFWLALGIRLGRLISRQHGWVVVVRRADDDPVGEVLHEEEVARADDAKARVAALKADIQGGTPPWESAQSA